MKEALAQPEQEKERCVGCEACIDTACGRDECPKGWPKAAQPEQEPVAHINQHGVIHEAGYSWGPTNRLEPLYTTPPQRTWVGLTVDEMVELVQKYRDTPVALVDTTEAKLKEKNT